MDQMPEATWGISNIEAKVETEKILVECECIIDCPNCEIGQTFGFQAIEEKNKIDSNTPLEYELDATCMECRDEFWFYVSIQPEKGVIQPEKGFAKKMIHTKF